MSMPQWRETETKVIKPNSGSKFWCSKFCMKTCNSEYRQKKKDMLLIILGVHVLYSVISFAGVLYIIYVFHSKKKTDN
jgi:hypothetical protein